MKIHPRYPAFILSCILYSLSVSLSPLQAQNKKTAAIPPPAKIVSWEILENGDTINRIDSRNEKQGKWLIVNKGGFGEPDFMELGMYADNMRTGKWRTYTMEGIITAEEFYRRGIKDGEARYYDEGHLYCVGNYLALRSKYEYDTIIVEDPVTELFKPVVIKTDVGSVRHGFWTYYDAPTTRVSKVIEYQVDEVIYEKEYTLAADSVYIKARMKSYPHLNGSNQNSNWSDGKGKKPVKYTDFPDDIQYVKPNQRKGVKK